MTAKIINSQKRSVNADWFDRYSWLTLCETRNVLLCHCCVVADRWGLIEPVSVDGRMPSSGLLSMRHPTRTGKLQ